MSASSSPTRWPCRASATARFTATVDFPTPPLPEATATMDATSGSSSGGFWPCPASGAGGGALCAVSTAVALVMPGCRASRCLDRAAHRLHRGRVRAVGQQRHLHQAVAQLDAVHQAGGDDVLAGGGVDDGAQRFAQRRRRRGLSRHVLANLLPPVDKQAAVMAPVADDMAHGVESANARGRARAGSMT